MPDIACLVGAIVMMRVTSIVLYKNLAARLLTGFVDRCFRYVQSDMSPDVGVAASD